MSFNPFHQPEMQPPLSQMGIGSVRLELAPQALCYAFGFTTEWPHAQAPVSGQFQSGKGGQLASEVAPPAAPIPPADTKCISLQQPQTAPIQLFNQQHGSFVGLWQPAFVPSVCPNAERLQHCAAMQPLCQSQMPPMAPDMLRFAQISPSPAATLAQQCGRADSAGRLPEHERRPPHGSATGMRHPSGIDEADQQRPQSVQDGSAGAPGAAFGLHEPNISNDL